MPGIGDDIKQVLWDLGKHVDIYKHNTSNPSGEYVDTEQNISETQVFESFHMLPVTAAYDSNMAAGDRLDFFNLNESFLIADISDQLFQSETYAKEGVLYKCNAKVDCSRKSGETRNSDYDLVPNWEPVFSGELGLFTGRLSDHNVVEERYGRFSTSSKILYLSKDLDVEQEDRCWVNGEKFQIQRVESDRIPGLYICGVSEDTRE